MRVNIKPLSVNEAWQGKRFKTKKYNAYINQVLKLLPPGDLAIDSPICLSLEFGLSSKNADIDNPLKCFIDCLQKKYGFNDKLIYELNVKKTDVKKGSEFIEWSYHLLKEKA